ncbi:MAG TPA: TauD/TfdA family dioxygenase [Streptosporangiaceae bacterium]|jgi:L-asparagine oxygenase
MSSITPSQITLTDEERDAFAQVATSLEEFDPVTRAEEFVFNAQIQSARLPERIRRAMAHFRRMGGDAGGMLVRGLPVDPVPPTPEHADFALGVNTPAARVFALAAALVGEQYGFLAELRGRIVQDILPVAGFEDTQQSISSRAPLELHCETVFTENRADVIGLLCLRPDPEHIAGTVLTSTSMFLPLLDDKTVAILHEPRFSTTVDGSFLRGGKIDHPIVVGPIKVLDGGNLRPRLRCDFAETKGLDDAAQTALDALYQAACATLIEVRLDAGDLLLIDNHDAFHGRTPFKFHQSPDDRWLLRTFITRDLSRSCGDRPGDGRIVDRDYTVGPDIMASR